MRKSAIIIALLSTLILLLALLLIIQPPYTQASPTTMITISGTITGPGGPVSGVWVNVGSPEDGTGMMTGAGGAYSVSLETSGRVWINVRPDVATHLAQANVSRQEVTASFTQNFTLTTGHLLSLRFTNGAPMVGNIWTDVQPLQHQSTNDNWFVLDWDDPTQHYRAVLPPDVYHVTASHLPAGYYNTAATFDVRTADRIEDLPLNTSYVSPIPYDPPDASKISIGPIDDLGEATISGSAGAALPLAHVLLVNLNTTHQGHAFSNADGSFSAVLFAPPGSALMIKHGPAGQRWNYIDAGLAGGVTPFPGTIIHVPITATGDPQGLLFAAAGTHDHFADDVPETLNYVSSAWSLTGTLRPIFVDGEWSRVLTGTYESSVVPGLYRGGFNWTHPALVDLDHDNDLDFVIGERSGSLALYRNAGTTSAPDWHYVTGDFAGVHTDWWAYPALVDVTNDNAPDLFVGSDNGTVSIYYNDGTSTVPSWPDIPDVSLATSNDNAAPALDDLDGDGDLDLVVGQSSGTLFYFKNTGTLTNPAWSLQTSSYGGISEAGGWLQPAFIDLDGDLDRDLLIGLCGQLLWYQRGGTIANPTWTRQASDPIGFGGGSCGTSPAIGNWDGDSDQDIVVGEHWGTLRFFRNDGVPTWSEQTFEFPFELAGDTAPALTDWDNDGDNDLLIGQVWGNVEKYTNTGSAGNPNWQHDGTLLTLPWTDHPHAFPTFADIDGDNDDDLFIGEGGWQGPAAGGNLYFYRNDGTAFVPNWTLVVTDYLSLDVGGWSRPVFVDIDHDNDLDLFIGDEVGTLTFVQNTGTVNSPTWAAPIRPYADLDVGDYSAPSFFDLDQDGDLDMLIGSENGSLAYVRNTGTITTPSWYLVATQYPGIDTGGNSSPAAADVNGDNKPDLLLGGIDGGLNLYHYVGPGTPPPLDNVYAPGDLYRIEAKLRLYGPAITTTTDVNAINIFGSLHYLMLYDAQGKPQPAENYFMSSLLTPSGFPIQRGDRPVIDANTGVGVGNLHSIGGHALEGDITFSGQIPADMPSGMYRPAIYFNINGVPTSTNWLAANVVYHTFYPEEAALPPIVVDDDTVPVSGGTPQHLIWKLLMDDFVQGTRGSLAREDQGTIEFTSQIVSQGAPQTIPPVDERTGQAITYRLEPFLPMMSYTDRRMPTPPLIPFDLPGGDLHVKIQKPDGTLIDLGSEAFAQSFNRSKTTRAGQDLNSGTVQLEDVYSLKAATDRFRVTFDQYGRHVITMTGTISDVWGNQYEGGGTYAVWLAHALDLDPGVLPMTPLAVGDAFNPTLNIEPRVPADVKIGVTLYPDSDPARAITNTLIGQANDYGYFGSNASPITMTAPGEYRVDVTATYTDADGKLYMGSLTWGNIVMTPDVAADLIAHGRRGLDSLLAIPNHWFVNSRDLSIPSNAISHSLNPYYNGDVYWSRMSDGPYGGDSLILGASVQDTVGVIAAAVQARANRVNPPLAAPGSLAERFSKNEIPLFSSTRSGLPIQIAPPEDVDQIAYSYRSSQRPGLRVREVVAEDGQSGGYWRLDTLYDDQLSVGVLGDQPNDFKFQYVGVVYRDLDSGHNEYRGQGTGWVFIPESDTTGSRVMPPFAGPGNGGWTTEGGPLLMLKGQAIHMFILPTGVGPGTVLEVGDTFHFAGHLMPTLNSKVAITVTAPNGSKHLGGGQANSIGYFYDPTDNFTIDQAGLWSVDVHVWHDGQCSGGATIPPYPSGDVLGSQNGRYWFYVVPGSTPRLIVTSPSPGFLHMLDRVSPITITGSIPADWSNVTLDYTIAMPGYILKQAQVTTSGSTFQFVFDPVTLAQDYPNLDLSGRDDWQAGLADTFTIGMLLRGQSGGQSVQRANVITLQGNQVYVGESDLDYTIFLPLMRK